MSPSLEGVRPSLFSSLQARLGRYSGEVYPLHIGDTWRAAPPGCRVEDVLEAEHPGVHRYAPVQGEPALIEAIRARMTPRLGAEVDPASVLVTAGATGGLGAVVGALLAPGDEVLVLAPTWPLFAGIVRSFHATPIFVPIPAEASGPAALTAALAAAMSPRTAAVYVNTPNNPTGRVLPRAWLDAVAAFARAHDLWLLADEVYEELVYEGDHIYAAALAPERAFSVHSLSKSFGMAGHRCGWVLGPPAAMAQVRKVSTHTFYSTPGVAQVIAARALTGRADAWLAETRAAYRAMAEEIAGRLQVPVPQGGTFLFLDVADALDARGLGGFLEDCVDQGLLLAPGDHFGPFPTHLRLCFTSAPPEVVRRGVEILARRWGR